MAPIRQIDTVTIGEGKKGEVTSVLQRKFFDVLDAREEKYMKWLDPVYE
jgi:branched-chain amino acid aminotransferase